MTQEAVEGSISNFQSVDRTTISDQEALAFYMNQQISEGQSKKDNSVIRNSIQIKPLDLTPILQKREDENRGKPCYTVSPLKNS